MDFFEWDYVKEWIEARSFGKNEVFLGLTEELVERRKFCSDVQDGTLCF